MKTGKVHCVVLSVGPEGEQLASDALPWADPYILGLIAKLQQEVKMERARGGEITWDESCFEFDLEEEDDVVSDDPEPRLSDVRRPR